MDADLQRRFEALGFLPGDVKVEQESSVEMPKDLNDLYSNPEVSNIRISSHQPENSGAWLAEGELGLYCILMIYIIMQLDNLSF
jgi:hypothetical protein